MPQQLACHTVQTFRDDSPGERYEIAVREKETALTDIPADEVKQIYMSFYHRHIPELSEAGFVRYDQERDIVTLTKEAEQIEQYQEFLTVK